VVAGLPAHVVAASPLLAGDTRAKGKCLGCPTIGADRFRITCLRAQGRGWKAIAREMKSGSGRCCAPLRRSQNPHRERQGAVARLSSVYGQLGWLLPPENSAAANLVPVRLLEPP